MWQAHFLIYVQGSSWCFSQHPTCIPSSYPLLNQNWSSTNISSIFLSNILLSIPRTIFAVCTMIVNVCWSLYFVAFSFFFKAMTVTSVHCGPLFSFTYLFNQLCHSAETIFVPTVEDNNKNTFFPHHLDSFFFHFTSQNWAVLVCIYFLLMGSF